MKNGYSTYKTANVDTTDQGKLIIIAYDVAIKHSRMALNLFTRREDIEERTKHIFKVQDAITELMSSLRMDVGEIAKNLYMLYDYMLRKLIQASTKNEPGCVEEVVGYLVDLRSAWKDAIAQVKSGNGNQGTAPSSVQPGSIAVSG